MIRPETHIPSFLARSKLNKNGRIGAEGGIVSEGVAQVIEDLGTPLHAIISELDSSSSGTICLIRVGHVGGGPFTNTFGSGLGK